MIPNHVCAAAEALRRFDPDLDRATAEKLLSMWAGRWTLANEEVPMVLAHFDNQKWPAAIHHHQWEEADR